MSVCAFCDPLEYLQIPKRPLIPKGREVKLTWYHPCKTARVDETRTMPMRAAAPLLRVIGRTRKSLIEPSIRRLFQPFGSEGRFREGPYRLAPADDSLKPKPAHTDLIIALRKTVGYL